jgi:hypothetical protein
MDRRNIPTKIAISAPVRVSADQNADSPHNSRALLSMRTGRNCAFSSAAESPRSRPLSFNCPQRLGHRLQARRSLPPVTAQRECCGSEKPIVNFEPLKQGKPSTTRCPSGDCLLLNVSAAEDKLPDYITHKYELF